MPTFHEYQMDDGSIVLVEAKSTTGGIVKASGGMDVVQAGRKFTEAFTSICGSR